LEPDWSLRIGRQCGNSRNPKRITIASIELPVGIPVNDWDVADINVGSAMTNFESGRFA